MNILHQYYRGITNQMRAEVDLINSIFQHQGVKGSGNEQILRDLTTKFVAQRFGVGTGIVIDKNGKQSRQCDIVVYDTLLYPSLFTHTSAHIFPVDIVYAVVEVKTTLDSGSAKESIENINSVVALDYIKHEFWDAEGKSSHYAVGSRTTTPPIGAVLAYDSDCLKDDTFKNWFVPKEDSQAPSFPAIVCAIDMGLVRFLTVPPTPGMTPEGLIFPLARLKEGAQEPITTDKVEFMEIPQPVRNGATVTVEGTTYPIKLIGENYMAIDQGQNLLHFLLFLNDLITAKKISPLLNFTDTYLRGIDNFHFRL